MIKKIYVCLIVLLLMAPNLIHAEEPIEQTQTNQVIENDETTENIEEQNVGEVVESNEIEEENLLLEPPVLTMSAEAPMLALPANSEETYTIISRTNKLFIARDKRFNRANWGLIKTSIIEPYNAGYGEGVNHYKYETHIYNVEPRNIDSEILKDELVAYCYNSTLTAPDIGWGNGIQSQTLYESTQYKASYLDATSSELKSLVINNNYFKNNEDYLRKMVLLSVYYGYPYNGSANNYYQKALEMTKNLPLSFKDLNYNKTHTWTHEELAKDLLRYATQICIWDATEFGVVFTWDGNTVNTNSSGLEFELAKQIYQEAWDTIRNNKEMPDLELDLYEPINNLTEKGTKYYNGDLGRYVDYQNMLVVRVANETIPNIGLQVKANISVIKKLDDEKPGSRRFKFTLLDENNQVLQTKENDNDGNVVFDTLEYNKEGTYKYSIKEVNDNQIDIGYDRKIIEINVIVSKEYENNIKVEYSDNTFNNTLLSTGELPSAGVLGNSTKGIGIQIIILALALEIIRRKNEKV